MEQFAYPPSTRDFYILALQDEAACPATSNGHLQCGGPLLLEKVDQPALLGDEGVDADGLSIEEIRDLALQSPIGNPHNNLTELFHVDSWSPDVPLVGTSDPAKSTLDLACEPRRSCQMREESGLDSLTRPQHHVVGAH